MVGKSAETLTRRAQILTAAVEIFSEKGFYATRVEEIAQRAGIGKGTIYQYFTTKEVLFQEVLQAGMDDYWRQIHREQSSADPLAVRLQRIASIQLGYAVKHRNMAKVLMNSPETVSPDSTGYVSGDPPWDSCRTGAAFPRSSAPPRDSRN
jgi:AcrR family transcriptional regulator